MPAVTIRDVPAETRNELAARAARSGRSLQEYLRMQLIEMAERVDKDELVDRARRRVNDSGITVPTETILGWRDEDR